MFQYKFDKETENMLVHSLALHKYRGYVGGFEALRKYFASICFEKMLVRTSEDFQPEFESFLERSDPNWKKWHEPSAGQCIFFLKDKGLVTKSDELDSLDRCRKLRNDVMHSKKKQETLEEDTLYVLNFLCEKKGWNFEEEIEKRTFEEISEFGEGCEPADDQKEFSELVYSDFDNFEILYRKCRDMQRAISRKLWRSSHLESTRMSGFTYDAGGIWLPWVQNPGNDHRAHVSKASLGVIFTPLDIRIGLDFGPKAYRHREEYYKMLINGEIADFVKRLPKRCEYSFCDTVWFYHIRNIRSTDNFAREGVEIELKKTEELRQKYEKEEHELYLLKGNRHLLGKVVNRFPETNRDTSDRFLLFTRDIVNVAAETLNELAPLLSRIESAALS
jgi:hypothetical protein